MVAVFWGSNAINTAINYIHWSLLFTPAETAVYTVFPRKPYLLLFVLWQRLQIKHSIHTPITLNNIYNTHSRTLNISKAKDIRGANFLCSDQF